MTSTTRRGTVDAATIRAHLVGDRLLDLFVALGLPRPAKRLTPCSLHNDRHGASLSVTPSTGLWYCHAGCGGGTGVDLVMVARSLGVADALAWLADWLGLTGSEPMPALTRPVASTPPAVDAGPFLSALWGIVGGGWSTVSEVPDDECAWSAPVAAWLAESRGIEPDAAYALGCRDWATRRHEIAELVAQTSTDVLEAAGMVRDGKLWAPLRGCLRGDAGAAGVAVPAWRLGAAYPERWRWRLVSPWRGAAGLLKSVACFGPGADFLGAGLPSRPAGAEVRVAPIGSVPLLILTEGEPDWWSVVEAVDGAAAVVAVCGGSPRWRDAWPSMPALRDLGVRRIAVVVHAGKPDENGRGHGDRFSDAVADACASAGLVCDAQNPREGYDLNDRHKKGELREWLRPLLEEAT